VQQQLVHALADLRLLLRQEIGARAVLRGNQAAPPSSLR
jgi:hypothetical protein